MSTPDPELLITKHAMVMEIPEELLMDMGVIPDTRPAPKPVGWRRRLRWWFAAKRISVGGWAYRRIAGQDVPEDDSW